MKPKTGEPTGWITAITFSSVTVAIFSLVLLATGIWVGLRTLVALIAVLSIITHRQAYGNATSTKTVGTQSDRSFHNERDWRDA